MDFSVKNIWGISSQDLDSWTDFETDFEIDSWTDFETDFEIDSWTDFWIDEIVLDFDWEKLFSTF
jgi:hypothetical protein